MDRIDGTQSYDTHELCDWEGRADSAICLHSVAFPFAVHMCALPSGGSVVGGSPKLVLVSPPHQSAPRFGVVGVIRMYVWPSRINLMVHTNILVARRVIFTLVLPLLGVLYAVRWYYYSGDYDILYAYNKIINKGCSVLSVGSMWSVSRCLYRSRFKKVTIKFINNSCVL